MIGIVVGVNLIAPVNSVVNTITTSAGYTQAVVSLTGVLPIIFVTVIILGAVAWISEIRSKTKNAFKRILSMLNSSNSGKANYSLTMSIC
jgi:ABC-type antimicrobial peptide transport system permease subunit